jgi:hypothetical protein
MMKLTAHPPSQKFNYLNVSCAAVDIIRYDCEMMMLYVRLAGPITDI